MVDCRDAAAGVVIAEAAAALTAAILMYSWMYSAKTDTWLAACSGAGSRWLRAPPLRRRQRAAAAELPCVRRGEKTRACAHGDERDARNRFTALLKVTKSTFWGTSGGLETAFQRVRAKRSFGPPPLFS